MRFGKRSRAPGNGPGEERREFPMGPENAVEPNEAEIAEDQSSFFFWAMSRLTRSASKAPSKGFLKPSWKPRR